MTFFQRCQAPCPSPVARKTTDPSHTMTDTKIELGSVESGWDEIRNTIESRQDFVLNQLDQLADQIEQLVELCVQVREGNLPMPESEENDVATKAA